MGGLAATAAKRERKKEETGPQPGHGVKRRGASYLGLLGLLKYWGVESNRD